MNTWLLGICCIIFVTVVWTVASVIKSWIFKEDAFEQPLFVCVICNSCYLIQFVTYAVWKWW